eukprot:scaffold14140_cov80-Skeletonema_marinoi.AAC.2
MLRTSGIDDAETLDAHQIDQFIVNVNAAWAIRSTYHTVLKATPGEAIFGRDMLFDIPFEEVSFQTEGNRTTQVSSRM